MVEIILSSLWDPSQPLPHWVKAYSDRVLTPESAQHFELHVTAVRGGFGVSSQAVARHNGDAWAALMERFEGSQYLSDQALASDPSSDGKVGTPYHYVIRPQEPVVIALHHPSRYTWHGNGGNSTSLGVAVDMAYDEEGIDANWLRSAFLAVVTHAAEQAFLPRYLEAHRQHSSSRGNDPGEYVWPVLESAAAEVGVIPTITRTTGSGRPIPDSWRPDDAPTVPDPGPSPVLPGSSADQVTAVQGSLASWGFDPGPADGLWGPNSQAALDAWVRSVG